MRQLAGMAPEAAYAINPEWGDSAMANFFGTQAAADAADPLDWSFFQLNKSPETLRSHFVTDAQTAYYRDSSQTSKRFGLGASGLPGVVSAGYEGFGMNRECPPGYFQLASFVVMGLATYYVYKHMR